MPSRQARDKAPPLPEPPPLPGAPAVPAEPKAASARHSESGKEAFKAQQYGRAERNFRRAAEGFPEDRQAHFLLAQAQFALGKYAEAVAAIYAGMRLQPNWPSARYRPRDFYGTHSDDFSDQLKRLAETVAKNPDDPFLAFLYAYQLWFDNRKDEARLLFERAKTLTSDPSFSERFLQANPGSSVDDVVVELLPPGPRF
jgi:tetratricopeptide (TPR) repeat protein